MKFRGVLVRPLREQEDRDGLRVNPKGVRFDPKASYPIFPNFDHLGLPIGFGWVTREKDGSLTVRGETYSHATGKLAFGGSVIEKRVFRKKEVATKSTLMEIGLTENHSDPTHPPIEEIKPGDEWDPRRSEDRI